MVEQSRPRHFCVLRKTQLLLCVMAPLLLWGNLAAAQKPVLRRPHHDPGTAQEAAGGLWRTDRDFDALLHIKNILLKQPLDVTPVIYTADGTEVDLPKVTLPAAGVASLNIGRMLRNAALGAHLSSYGTASVRYNWSWAAVLATIQNTDEMESITFHSTLSTNITQLRDPASTPSTHTLKGMWWAPHTAPAGFIALSNVTSQSLTTQLSLTNAASQAIASRAVTISPRATTLLAFQDLLSSVTDADATGTLLVTYTGVSGSIAASMGIENRTVGYSTSPKLSEVSASEDPAGPVELVAPGVMVGAPDPAMLFPATTVFSPYAFLQNLSAQSIQVAVLAANNGGPRTPLGAVTLPANGTSKVDIAGMIARAGAQLGPESTNLLFSYNGRLGDLSVEAGSTDQTDNYVFEVRVNAEVPTISRTICYWTIDGDNDTMLDLWNYTKQASDEVLTIQFSGGQYKVPVHLPAGGGTTLSMHKLQHLQTPDIDGHTLPLNITEGSALLASATGETASMSVAVSVASFNVRNATCGSQCTTCNGVSEFTVGPSPLPLVVQQKGQMAGNATYNTGTTQSITTGSWTSATTSIASVGNTGMVTGLSAGQSQIQLITDSYPVDAGNVCAESNPTCPQASFGGESPAQVSSPPTITSVTPLTLGVTGGTVIIMGTNFSSISGNPTLTSGSGNATFTNPVVNTNTNTITANYSVSCSETATDSLIMTYNSIDGSSSGTSRPVSVNIPSAPIPTVLLNGSSVSGTQTVSVGQQLPLTASIPALPNCMSLSAQTWGISAGTAVGGYVNAAGNGPPDTTGGRTLSSASTTGSDTIYWTTPVSSTSTYQYTMSSPAAGSASSPVVNTNFTVNGPTSAAMNTTIDQPFIGGHPFSLELGNYPAQAGEQFTASATISNSSQTANGNYFFTQLVNTYNAAAQRTSTPCSYSPGVGLDNSFHYGNLNGVTSTSDSPEIPIFADYTSLSVSFSASMYLMWQATTTNSIPIPLGSVNWSWSGTANYVNSTWQLASSSENAGTFIAGAGFPTWTSANTNGSVPSSCQ